jgi:F0F1-type ATP synthase epsilon subunit
MKTVRCEIVTPEKVFLSAEADFIAAPAFEGVMAGHARLIARLVPGTLRIVKGKESERFALASGFIRIEPDAVRIFTPEVMSL